MIETNYQCPKCGAWAISFVETDNYEWEACNKCNYFTKAVWKY